MKRSTKSVNLTLVYSFIVSALFVFTIASCNTTKGITTNKMDRKAALTKMINEESPEIDKMTDDLTSFGFGDDGTKDSLLNAIQLFNGGGSIDSATVAFETYLAHYEDDQVALFFNGLCQLNKGEFSSAIKLIQPLVQDDKFEYKDCATYYLATAYFGLDNNQGDAMAKKYFNLLAKNPASHYQKEAKMYVEQFL